MALPPTLPHASDRLAPNHERLGTAASTLSDVPPGLTADHVRAVVVHRLRSTCLHLLADQRLFMQPEESARLRANSICEARCVLLGGGIAGYRPQLMVSVSALSSPRLS